MGALERVKAVLAQLPEEDLRELHRFLGDLVEMPTALPKRAAEAHTVASVRVRDAPGAPSHAVTYRRETVKCGKPKCKKCPHGPYLYKYWRDGGRLRKAYVGKAAGHEETGIAPSAEEDAGGGQAVETTAKREE